MDFDINHKLSTLEESSLTFNFLRTEWKLCSHIVAENNIRMFKIILSARPLLDAENEASLHYVSDCQLIIKSNNFSKQNFIKKFTNLHILMDKEVRTTTTSLTYMEKPWNLIGFRYWYLIRDGIMDVNFKITTRNICGRGFDDFENPFFGADLCLDFGNQELFCNSTSLRNISSCFDEIIDRAENECVKFPVEEKDTISAMLQIMANQQDDFLNDQNVENLLRVAVTFQINGLLEKCEKFLQEYKGSILTKEKIASLCFKYELKKVEIPACYSLGTREYTCIVTLGEYSRLGDKKKIQILENIIKKMI